MNGVLYHQRWNFQECPDGSVGICKGLHEKSDACEYERYVPETELLASHAREVVLRSALQAFPAAMGTAESDWVPVPDWEAWTERIDDALTQPAPPVVPKSVADAQMKALEYAWTIIANAGGGDWSKESRDWQLAAVKFRDDCYYPALTAYRETTKP